MEFQSAVSETIWQCRLKLRGKEGAILLLHQGIVTIPWECLRSAGGAISGSLEARDASDVCDNRAPE